MPCAEPINASCKAALIVQTVKLKKQTKFQLERELQWEFSRELRKGETSVDKTPVLLPYRRPLVRICCQQQPVYWGVPQDRHV